MCGEKRSFSKPCGVHDECAAFPLTFLFPIFEKPLLFSFDIQPEEGPSIRAETSYPMGHIHLRGKWRPRTPRWYNAALTHTK